MEGGEPSIQSHADVNNTAEANVVLEEQSIARHARFAAAPGTRSFLHPGGSPFFAAGGVMVDAAGCRSPAQQRTPPASPGQIHPIPQKSLPTRSPILLI